MSGADAPAASGVVRVHSTRWPVVVHVHPVPFAVGVSNDGSTSSITLTVPAVAVLPMLVVFRRNALRWPALICPTTNDFSSLRSIFSSVAENVVGSSLWRVAGSPSVATSPFVFHGAGAWGATWVRSFSVGAAVAAGTDADGAQSRGVPAPADEQFQPVIC